MQQGQIKLMLFLALWGAFALLCGAVRVALMAALRAVLEVGLRVKSSSPPVKLLTCVSVKVVSGALRAPQLSRTRMVGKALILEAGLQEHRVAATAVVVAKLHEAQQPLRRQVGAVLRPLVTLAVPVVDQPVWLGPTVLAREALAAHKSQGALTVAHPWSVATQTAFIVVGAATAISAAVVV
tara:strand:- start:480 stop:1025 length:546 start_codon:yes stop_codon:yes gene_type:complete